MLGRKQLFLMNKNKNRGKQMTGNNCAAHDERYCYAIKFILAQTSKGAKAFKFRNALTVQVL